MKTSSRNLFYVLVSILALGLIATAYFIFDPFGARIPQAALEKISKSVVKRGIGSSSSSRSSTQSESSKSSVWEQLTPDQLKERAVIDQNLSNLKQLYINARDKEFLEKLLTLRRENPNVPDYPAMLADYYFAQNELDKAEGYFHDLIALMPTNYFARNRLAEIQLKRDQNDEAIQTYTQVLNEDPGNGMAMIGILNAAEKADRHEDARSAIETAYKAKPSVDGAVVLSDLYLADGEPEKREEVLMESYRANPTSAFLNRVLALEFARKGDWSQFDKHIEASVLYAKNEKDKFQSLEMMADTALASNQPKLAKKAVDQLKQMAPNSERVSQLESDLALLTGEVSKENP